MAAVTEGRSRLRFTGLLVLAAASVLFATPRLLKGLEDLDGGWQVAFLIYAAAAVFAFVFGMGWRLWVWTSGRSDAHESSAAGALGRLGEIVLAQRRVLRERLVGSFHAALFWSFTMLFVIFSWPRANPSDYVFAALYLALGLGAMFLGVRLVLVTRRTRGLGAAETSARAVIPLLFVVTAVSYFFAARSPGALFFHFACVMTIFALIPYSRLLHVVAVPLWALVRPDDRFTLTLPFDLSRHREAEIAAADLPLGPRRRDEFPMRSLLAFDACTRCGRCEDVCPAHATGDAFSPARVMKHLQLGNTPWTPPADPVVAAEQQQVDACTTCGHCEVACPVGLEPLAAVLELRRSAAFEGRYETGHEAALRRVAASGRIWDAEQAPPVELEPAVPWPPDPADPPELVYWIGCAGRHDPAGQRIAATVAGLLNRAGIRWTTAGAEESCTGDTARRLGDEGLFQQLALRNIELLGRAGCNKILVNCAHCFNALARDYRVFGAAFEVVHHSELLLQLVRDGRLGRLTALPTKITFHDPCYLGRHHGRFEPARALLDAVEGFERIEMAETWERSRCCGAGGGRLWRDGEPGAGMATLRADQASQTRADALATACPFCLTMLEDPASKRDLRALDIAELIASAVRS